MGRPTRHSVARLAAYLFVVGMGAFGLWRLDVQNHRIERLVDRIEAERQERRDDACAQQTTSQEREEAMWDRILTTLGARQRIVDALHDGYNSQPPPAACDP